MSQKADKILHYMLAHLKGKKKLIDNQRFSSDVAQGFSPVF
jgi:hypothetical protein